MKIIKKYDEFNGNRYGNPWVAKVNKKGQIDFTSRVGFYSGTKGKGEAGALYLYEPEENGIYAYGQKDYRGHNSERTYIIYKNGEFLPITKTEIIEMLCD